MGRLIDRWIYIYRWINGLSGWYIEIYRDREAHIGTGRYG